MYFWDFGAGHETLKDLYCCRYPFFYLFLSRHAFSLFYNHPAANGLSHSYNTAVRLFSVKHIRQAADEVAAHVEWVKCVTRQFEGFTDTLHFTRKQCNTSAERIES